jgi:hypothetical protein
MEKLAPVGISTEELAHQVLLDLGHALLLGTTWENVFNDPRWTWRPLYIAYTHDKLGTPDQVEGVFFEQDEAEILIDRIAREHLRKQSGEQPFYKFKVANWPLGALAIRDARDSFHRSVVAHLVRLIKQTLQQTGKLPQDVTAVTIGAPNVRNSPSIPAYIDQSGNRIVLWEDGDGISSREETIVFCKRTNPPLCGLMNGAGEILVPAAFHKIAPLREGLAVVTYRGKFGYVDTKGNVITPIQYEEALDCNQGLLLVKSGGLWGALDRNGQVVIAPRYTALRHDSSNAALRATLDDGRHGYLSLTGQLLVGFSGRPLSLIKQAFVRDRSVLIARKNKGETVHVTGNAVGTSGKAACKLLVDVLGQPCGSHGFAAITYGGHDEGMLCASAQHGNEFRHGFISQHGQVLVDFRFAAAENFSEGLAAVTDPTEPMLYGYIDRRGNWVIPPRFDFAGEFRHGLAVASGSDTTENRIGLRERMATLLRRSQTKRKGSRRQQRLECARYYGYIDRTGEWVIEPRFLEAKPFSEGLAPVRTENGWGYIDICGIVVTPDRYQEAGPFRHGVARFGRRFDGPIRYGLLDCSGREIIPPRYDRLSYPQYGLITARDEFGLWGCITLYGNIAIPFIYREVHDLQMALTARSQTPHHLG